MKAFRGLSIGLIATLAGVAGLDAAGGAPEPAPAVIRLRATLTGYAFVSYGDFEDADYDPMEVRLRRNGRLIGVALKEKSTLVYDEEAGTSDIETVESQVGVLGKFGKLKRKGSGYAAKGALWLTDGTTFAAQLTYDPALKSAAITIAVESETFDLALDSTRVKVSK